jgi:hypothetical protein
VQIVLYPDTPYSLTPNEFEMKLIEDVAGVSDELSWVPDEEVLLEEVLNTMQTCYTFIRKNFSLRSIEKANIKHLDRMRLINGGRRNGEN